MCVYKGGGEQSFSCGLTLKGSSTLPNLRWPGFKFCFQVKRDS